MSILTMFASGTVAFGTYQVNTMNHGYNTLKDNSGEYNYLFRKSNYELTEQGETYCVDLGYDVSKDTNPNYADDIKKCNTDIQTDTFTKLKNDIEIVERNIKLITPSDIDNGHFFMLVNNITTGNIATNWTTAGRNAETHLEATVTPKYAERNNLSINDKVTIKGVDYTITGFTVSYDFAAPVMNIRYLFPNFDRETVIYTTPEGYDRINETLIPSRDIDDFYFVNGDANKLNTELEKYFKVDLPIARHKTDPNAHSISRRVTSIIDQVNSTKTINNVLMIFILSLTVFVMMVVIKNIIKRNKIQIGVLKAMGYKSYQIAFSYLTYAVVIGIIGGLIGVGTGYGLYKFYLPTFNNFFITNLNVNPTSIWELIFIMVLPFIIIVVPVYLLTWLALLKKPLQLMSANDGAKNNVLVRLSSKTLSKLKFKTRFKYSQAFKSPAKLFTMFITILASTILMLFMYSGLSVFDEIFQATYGSKSYDGAVRYSDRNHTIVINETDVYEYDWNTFNAGENLQGKSISYFQLREGYDELNALSPDTTSSESFDLFKSLLLVDEPINNPSVQALKEKFITIGSQVKEEGTEAYTYVKNIFITDQNNKNFEEEKKDGNIKINDLAFFGFDENSELYNVWKQNPESLKKVKEYSGTHWPVALNSFAATRADIKVGDVIEVAISEQLLSEEELEIKSYNKIEVVDIIDEYDSSGAYTLPSVISSMYQWYTNLDDIDTSWNGKLYKNQIGDGVKYINMGHTIKKNIVEDKLENEYLYNGKVAMPGLSIKSEPLLYVMGMHKDVTLTDPTTFKPLSQSLNLVIDLEYSINSFTNMLNLMKSSINAYILFAWFIAATIIIITTLVVLYDNIKTIITLKVLGYNNKEISGMTLTIYIPFILLAFIVSIPATRWVFGIIETVMRQNANSELPLRIGIDTMIKAFVAVLVIYSATFLISFNKMKKIKLNNT